jgi:hypothetical protein
MDLVHPRIARYDDPPASILAIRRHLHTSDNPARTFEAGPGKHLFTRSFHPTVLDIVMHYFVPSHI